MSVEEGKVFPCTGAKDRKWAGTNSGKSGTRRLKVSKAEQREWEGM